MVRSAETVDQLVDSIQRLRVRGALALGGAGALGVALAAHRTETDSSEAFAGKVRTDAERIAEARPAAVNLLREVDRVLAVLDEVGSIEAARERTAIGPERR